jgi:catechol 2,3-dioxygenase-like lactoylglutathione lyase family enzyme
MDATATPRSLAAETKFFGIILYVADFAACERFYKVVLGLAVIERKQALTMFAFGGAYVMVEDGGIGSAREKISPKVPPCCASMSMTPRRSGPPLAATPGARSQCFMIPMATAAKRSRLCG